MLRYSQGNSLKTISNLSRSTFTTLSVLKYNEKLISLIRNIKRGQFQISFIKFCKKFYIIMTKIDRCKTTIYVSSKYIYHNRDKLDHQFQGDLQPLTDSSTSISTYCFRFKAILLCSITLKTASSLFDVWNQELMISSMFSSRGREAKFIGAPQPWYLTFFTFSFSTLWVFSKVCFFPWLIYLFPFTLILPPSLTISYLKKALLMKSHKLVGLLPQEAEGQASTRYQINLQLGHCLIRSLMSLVSVL